MLNGVVDDGTCLALITLIGIFEFFNCVKNISHAISCDQYFGKGEIS